MPLLAGLGFVLFFRIGEPPAANPAEARVEAVVREMVRSGDWLVPRMDGQPRLHKPPGYYWAAAALSELAGGASWATVRAPSAIAALLLVGVVFAWGSALGGTATGLVAALCLSAMQFTLTFGRRGVAEMPLALFSMLALALFERAWFERREKLLPWFALALTGAILAKATVALLLVFLPIGLGLALDGNGRSHFAARLLGWSALGLALGFAWYAIVLAIVPHARETILAEALLPVGIQVEGEGSALHYRGPTTYLGPFLTGTLPAVIFLPLAIRRWVSSRLYAGDARRRFVALAFLSLLGAFALIPQKQRHYLLPLLPLLALLLADAIADAQARQRLRQGLLWVAGFALPLGLAAAALLALFYHDFLAVPAPICAALLAGGAGLSAAMLWTARRGEVRAFAVLSAAGTLCLMLAWFGSIDIWKRQFEAGTAVARPDYHAARWQWASERHPLIARFVTEPPGSNATEHPGNR